LNACSIKVKFIEMRRALFCPLSLGCVLALAPHVGAGTLDSKPAACDKLLPKYEKLLADYPTKGIAPSYCVRPQTHLDKRTRRFSSRINSAFTGKANFCGGYFLMDTPISGGGDAFVFDCKTGRPVVYSPNRKNEGAINIGLMKLESCAFVSDPPMNDETVSDIQVKSWGVSARGASPPKVYFFNGKKMIKLSDPILRR
jgi:hypothetical protein